MPSQVPYHLYDFVLNSLQCSKTEMILSYQVHKIEMILTIIDILGDDNP